MAARIWSPDDQCKLLMGSKSSYCEVSLFELILFELSMINLRILMLQFVKFFTVLMKITVLALMVSFYGLFFWFFFEVLLNIFIFIGFGAIDGTACAVNKVDFDQKYNFFNWNLFLLNLGLFSRKMYISLKKGKTSIQQKTFIIFLILSVPISNR